MQNKVLCIYPGPIFSNDLNHVAGSGRLVNLSQIISQVGYDVTVASFESHSKITGEKKQEISYVQLTAYENVCKLKLNKSGSITSFLKSNKFDYVVFYGTSIKYTYFLRKYCQKHSIKFIQSVNEWGRFNLKSIISYFMLKIGLYNARKSDGLILISNFMMKKYQKYSAISLIKIPSIFDTNEFIFESKMNRNSRISIAYAGSISNNKDMLSNLILAYDQLSNNLKGKIEFNLYGPTYEELLETLNDDNVLSRNKESVHLWGYIPRDILRKELKNHDFTVLLREKLPYAEAGFPTKFGESIVLGIPVIANITSDIGEYLIDGINGFICESENVEDVKRVLETVAILSDVEIEELKQNTLQSGRFFDFKYYKNQMEEFMRRI